MSNQSNSNQNIRVGDSFHRKRPCRHPDHRSAGVEFSGSDAVGRASSLTLLGLHRWVCAQPGA
jgi:hypothetical protein